MTFISLDEHSGGRHSHSIVPRANIFKYFVKRRCGGLGASTPVSRPPVLGSNLGSGPPHSVVRGAEDHTVIPVVY